MLALCLPLYVRFHVVNFASSNCPLRWSNNKLECKSGSSAKCSSTMVFSMSFPWFWVLCYHFSLYDITHFLFSSFRLFNLQLVSTCIHTLPKFQGWEPGQYPEATHFATLSLLATDRCDQIVLPSAFVVSAFGVAFVPTVHSLRPYCALIFLQS